MDKYKITFNTWNKVADLYQEKFMHLDLYNESYDFFLEKIKKSNAKILEIGCGPGNITKYLLDKKPTYKILGVDVAPNMVALAKENNPAAKFQQMDCRAIHHIDKKFDAIICGFCLPYLSKEDYTKLISDSFDLLNEAGVFYFSTIEGDYENSGYQTGSSGDQTFVYYYQESFLKDILSKNNFIILSVFKVNYVLKDNSNQVHLIFIVKKAL